MILNVEAMAVKELNLEFYILTLMDIQNLKVHQICRLVIIIFLSADKQKKQPD